MVTHTCDDCGATALTGFGARPAGWGPGNLDDAGALRVRCSACVVTHAPTATSTVAYTARRRKARQAAIDERRGLFE